MALAYADNVLPMTPRREDEPSTAMLRDMIISSDQKHDDGHKRLRTDVREIDVTIGGIENRLLKVENDLIAAHASIRQLKGAPLDGMKLQFPIKVVATVIAAIVLASIGLVVKIDSTQSAVETKITTTTNELSSKIAEAQKDQKRTDERLTEQQQSIQQLRNRFELLQNDVTQFMIQQGTKRGR